MTRAWSSSAVHYLLDTTRCPRCATGLSMGVCPSCGTDLTGEAGARLWTASQAAAGALERRQEIIDALPRSVPQPVAPAPVAAPVDAGAPVAAAQRASSTAALSVQSVLAVAGAGLVAVAAVVFTFLNPDLADFRTRTIVIGVVTLVFLGAAWLLHARKLTFSAEAVAALGAVLAGLDVWALSESAVIPIQQWFTMALGAVVVSSALVVLSVLTRMRAWAWSGMLGLTAVPVFVGLGIDAVADVLRWWTTTGLLAAAAVTLVLGGVLVPRLAERFGVALRVELTTLAAARIVAAAALLIVVFTIPGAFGGRALGTAGLLAGLAGVALLSAKAGQAAFWSIAAGVVGGTAFAALPAALSLPSAGWLIALVPTSAAIAVVLLARAPLPPGVDRPHASTGALVIAIVAALPAAVVGFFSGAVTAAFGFLGGLARAGASGGGIWEPVGGWFGTSADFTVGPMLGAAAGTAALLASRTRPGTLVAPWAAILTAVALVSSGAWSRPIQVGLGVLVVVAFAFAARLPLFRAQRTVLLTGAHVILLGTILIAWAHPAIAVVAAIATLVALAALAWALPAGARAWYVAAGYGYALLILARGLSDARLSTIVVLSLVTAIACLVALVTTLVRRVPNPWWTGILVVTSVPFAIGVGSVVAERSGWTGLSTAVAFALALTLALSERPGLHVIVRTLAAALLVPSMAVVVVCVGAQVLADSASPITLPVIAAVVAVVLPCARLIERVFARSGLSVADAARSRLAIELSSLLTGAIAVVLALVRDAAGLLTAILVFVIIAVGSAVAGAIRVRRWAWVVSGVAWTGALWCWLAELGVTLPEAYLLPPAVGTAVVGAGLAIRSASMIPLLLGGLGGVVLPSLLLLVTVGPAGDALPWRTVGLLGGSVVFLALAAVLRRSGRDGPARLVMPLLGAACVAAAAGPVQAVRTALGIDPTTVAGALPVLGAAFALSAAGALVAAVGGWLLSRSGAGTGRATFVPALAYLVAGPVAAVQVDPIVVLILWILMAALLGLAIVTAAAGSGRARLLPPVWATWAAAWAVAVSAWSTRDYLRVEAFSLPLGLALLAAALVALRQGKEGEPFRVWAWPFTASSSWQRFTPALVVVLGTSMLATFTDPRTERAILVIALALVAVLLGSLLKQAAPFIIGVLVLPIENAIVFIVQIGTNIAALPWWITLATAGAALLVIAVTYERRASSKGVGARLRDLR